MSDNVNFTENKVNEVKIRLSKLIQDTRNSLNISQAELARLTGSTVSTISRIERNILSPNSGLLIKIFLVLDCPVKINDKVIL